MHVHTETLQQLVEEIDSLDPLSEENAYDKIMEMKYLNQASPHCLNMFSNFTHPLGLLQIFT